MDEVEDDDDVLEDDDDVLEDELIRLIKKFYFFNFSL
jgi:hypothetical protein